jgi:chlorite dismutase
MSFDTAHRPVAPPITVEGWYACHQLFTIDRKSMRARGAASDDILRAQFVRTCDELANPDAGWTRVFLLSGSTAEVMIIHFRPTLDEIGRAQRRILSTSFAELLVPLRTYLSIAEAGMYGLVAELTREAQKRGGQAGDDLFNIELARRTDAQRSDPHVIKRLYPAPPTEDMPFVCYYPMSKRREPEQNWYELPAEDRGRIMWEHGKSGRRHAGSIRQIVSGSIGLDEWEWGVTLFGTDPVAFKKAVTDMRFDEASARYAEFGEFYVGRVLEPSELLAELLV